MTASALRIPNAAVRSEVPAAESSARTLRMSDIVGALTRALDITEGQPEGHALRSCFVGMRTAQVLGLDHDQRSDLYYALLLKDLGCSSNSAKIAALFGADDRVVKERYKVHNLDRPQDGLRFVLSVAGSDAPPTQRLRHVIDVSLGRGGGTRAFTEVRCERGADIARHMGFTEATAAAIRALDEHWDGRGHPYGLAGDEIPLLGRILCLAQTVEVFAASFGPDRAAAMAVERSGTWFDPDVVEAFSVAQAWHDFWMEFASPEIEAVVAGLEPEDRILAADEERLDRLAEAFARVIDAKSPWTFRHSERVRALAVGAALQLDLADDELRALSRAALLHDLGKLGVSNRILDKRGRLTDDERAEIERHPAYTQRILERVAPFADFAEMASAHHERMDGSGYHRGRPGGALPMGARLLAVADQYEALTAHRPYREGRTPEAALAILRDDAGTGVDPVALEALEAFLASPAGQRWVRPEGSHGAA